MPASDDLTRDAELLSDAVREAGELALTLQRRGVERWMKPDGSPVSDGDLKVNDLLRARLMAARPGYGWLSEETPDDLSRLTCEYLWIVDPIDGTRAFIGGGTVWCVAAALVRSGHVAAAAIDCPAEREFLSAAAGAGAKLNGVGLAVVDASNLDGARVAGPRRAVSHLESLGMTAANPRDLPLQLRLAFVASGRVDAAVSLGPKNDWDLAAGELMVCEAGGTVSDSNGQSFIYNRREPWQQGLIASAPSRHPALVQALTGF